MQLSIKDVEESIFREFKAESVRERLKVGKALTLAMKLWLDRKRKKSKMSILDFKPKDWGRGSERTSEDIDKVVY